MQHEETPGRYRVQLEYQRFIGRKIAFIGGSLLLLIVLIGVAATIGSADISIGDAYAAMLSWAFPEIVEADELAVTIVFGLRLHRILFAVAAGFGLALCGAVMQGILRNPLASPFTLGISSAATFGASLAIVLGLGLLADEHLIIGNAFLFSLLAAFGIYGLARQKGMTAGTMVLAGILLMYLFSAMTSFLQYLGTSEQVYEVVFWTFGSLSRTTWEKLAVVAAIVGVCTPFVIWRSWDINAMCEGDEVAKSLGVTVDRVRTVMMILTSLMTAAIVCFTGTIGFIGLVAPHITRLAIGGDHRFLLPASGIVGAVILLGADCAARTLLPGQVIPVGIMTAFIGIPFFGYLFMRRGRDYW
ncbi:MAG: iron ABC transporter permease [Methanomicrobiaceae archaeon]|uniref:Iron(Iii) dicitrate transport system permease protein fecd n=1 Tax=hydrocarbon metagenome TaxID=938273 RepID=A0A0W8FG47_9ZZZZ|nr:iron ABC transporter permease [Methanomicrobiaceae archaeon]MDD5418592.1 iron ABC transporter permease [Methanomicrobiaceae archaeon]